MWNLKNKINQCIKYSCPDRISRFYVTFFFYRFCQKTAQENTAAAARKLMDCEPTRSSLLLPDFSSPFSRILVTMAGSEQLDLLANWEMFSSFQYATDSSTAKQFLLQSVLTILGFWNKSFLHSWPIIFFYVTLNKDMPWTWNHSVLICLCLALVLNIQCIPDNLT